MKQNRGREAGQTILVAALAMVALLTMVGLIVDGGFALASQRRNQNAVDAAANAGAVLLMENLPFGLSGQPQPRTDSAVDSAVVSTAVTNGVDPATVVAFYTDIEGERLVPPVEVGSLVAGAFPPPEAFGVEAEGSMTFGTFFAGIAGFANLSTAARATAVTGTAPGICSATEDCGFIPVTFPTSLTWCDGSNKQVWGSGGPYTIVTNPVFDNEITIPLCGTEAGSVGWLDILPNQDLCPGNGAAYLACYIENPNNPELDLPVWIDAQTGNVNSDQVQAALDDLTGPTVGLYEPGLDKIVTVPLYDCVEDDVPQPSHDHPCPTPPQDSVGTHTSYRVVALGAMILDMAYINGSGAECHVPPGADPAGNGATGCIKGWLTQISGPGEVGTPGSVPGSVFRVQLIR